MYALVAPGPSPTQRRSGMWSCCMAATAGRVGHVGDAASGNDDRRRTPHCRRVEAGAVGPGLDRMRPLGSRPSSEHLNYIELRIARQVWRSRPSVARETLTVAGDRHASPSRGRSAMSDRQTSVSAVAKVSRSVSYSAS